MEKFICIHGHFYQPPRENPWLERIEQQDSAYPYHDWNERILAECYGTNAFSRILGNNNRIQEIANNYEKMSFNFGPTLLSWMAGNAPDVYQAVIDADRNSRDRFSGHGSAMAQAYNHMIMPLANPVDKFTQIHWGIRDFEHHYGRRPEGMWLPETAVDLETLAMMADAGIKFTVLTPYQAGQVRKTGEKDWEDVTGGRINTRIAYRQSLPDKRQIAIFFYDGFLSHAVAFENLLVSGEAMAHKMLEAFAPDMDLPQLVHIAIDGETFGHHFAHADMALAYAIHFMETNNMARITNYGEFLELNPPDHEVRIIERTSWSCAHGVSRWHADCGCNSGSHPQWHQKWRQPLRDALDWLRDQLIPLYEKEAGSLLKDTWMARNDYIEVILDRSDDSLMRFMKRHLRSRHIVKLEKIRLFRLLEMQRNAMLMYTSCGWFFDELSGIETTQVIHYAGRALQLAEEACGVSLESEFMERLGNARSNIAEHGDGRRIYIKFVQPAIIDLSKVCAHYAMISLFDDSDRTDEETSVYCYNIRPWEHNLHEAGQARLAIGKSWVKSQITLEDSDLMYAVLYIGDHTLECAVSPLSDERTYRKIVAALEDAFAKVDFPGTIRQMSDLFEKTGYSLRNMFHDERQRILRHLMEPTIENAMAAYRRIYEPHVPLIRFFRDMNIAVPNELHAAARMVLNADLRAALETDPLDIDQIDQLLEDAWLMGIDLDVHSLEFSFRRHLERVGSRLADEPLSAQRLEEFKTAVAVSHHLPFDVNTRNTQNQFFDIWRNRGEELLKEAANRDVPKWGEQMDELAGDLGFETG